MLSVKELMMNFGHNQSTGYVNDDSISPCITQMRFERICNSLTYYHNKYSKYLNKELNSTTDEDVYKLTHNDIEHFREKCNKVAELYKAEADRGAVYRAMLDLNREIEYWERVFKELCCADWKKHLTVITDDLVQPLKDFAFVVCSIDSDCYKDEMRYPIVTATLFSPKQPVFYQDRKIALVLDMNPHHLIGMNVRSSAFSESYWENLFTSTILLGDANLSSVFYNNEMFCDFQSHDKEWNYHIDIGTITFSPEVGVQAVLCFNDASYKDSAFAESYARVCHIPIFKYTPDVGIERIDFI